MNILLVDDHALLRAELRMLLAGIYDGAVVIEAASVAEAIAIADHHPDLDLCLLDLGFREERGLAGLERITSVAPHCAMVVVSATDDGDTVRACLDRGAMSFIPKGVDPAVLVEALRRVLAGTVYLPEQVQGSIGSFRTRPALTPRQLDVLRCLGRALPTKLIARELDLSEHTVKEHTALLHQALGVHERTDSVSRAPPKTYGFEDSFGGVMVTPCVTTASKPAPAPVPGNTPLQLLQLPAEMQSPLPPFHVQVVCARAGWATVWTIASRPTATALARIRLRRRGCTRWSGWLEGAGRRTELWLRMAVSREGCRMKDSRLAAASSQRLRVAMAGQINALRSDSLTSQRAGQVPSMTFFARESARSPTAVRP